MTTSTKAPASCLFPHCPAPELPTDSIHEPPYFQGAHPFQPVRESLAPGAVGTLESTQCEAKPCPDRCDFHPWCWVHRRQINECVREKDAAIAKLRAAFHRSDVAVQIIGARFMDVDAIKAKEAFTEVRRALEASERSDAPKGGRGKVSECEACYAIEIDDHAEGRIFSQWEGHSKDLHARLAEAEELLRDLGHYWGWEDADPTEGSLHKRFNALLSQSAREPAEGNRPATNDSMAEMKAGEVSASASNRAGNPLKSRGDAP